MSFVRLVSLKKSSFSCVVLWMSLKGQSSSWLPLFFGRSIKWPLPTPFLQEPRLSKLTVSNASPLTFADVLPTPQVAGLLPAQPPWLSGTSAARWGVGRPHPAIVSATLSRHSPTSNGSCSLTPRGIEVAQVQKTASISLFFLIAGDG